MKKQILKMEKEIDQLKIENKEKEDALIELSQFYYVRKFIIYSNFNEKLYNSGRKHYLIIEINKIFYFITYSQKKQLIISFFIIIFIN